MSFPVTRPRRLRATPVLRKMVRETTLAPGDFIYPMFIVHGQRIRREIKSMPGICQLSVDQAVLEAQEAAGFALAQVVVSGISAAPHEGGVASCRQHADPLTQGSVLDAGEPLPAVHLDEAEPLRPVVSKSPGHEGDEGDDEAQRIGIEPGVGGHAAEAENGPRALELFRQHRPEVVLMDLRLHGDSGIRITKAIRAELRWLGRAALLEAHATNNRSSVGCRAN